MEIEIDILEDIESINKGIIPKLKKWQIITVVLDMVVMTALFSFMSIFLEASFIYKYVCIMISAIPIFVVAYSKKGLDFIETIKYSKEKKVFIVEYPEYELR